MITIKAVSDGVTIKLDTMIKRAESFEQFFKRNLRNRYLTAQQRRFETENNSEFSSGGWGPISEWYRIKKLTRFADYPGSGTKLLIATNRLMKSMLALSGDYRELVRSTRMVISTVVGYAPHVSEKRSLTSFNQYFYDLIRQDLKEYLRA